MGFPCPTRQPGTSLQRSSAYRVGLLPGWAVRSRPDASGFAPCPLGRDRAGAVGHLCQPWETFDRLTLSYVVPTTSPTALAGCPILPWVAPASRAQLPVFSPRGSLVDAPTSLPTALRLQA
jgi:hypothetical protein